MYWFLCQCVITLINALANRTHNSPGTHRQTHSRVHLAWLMCSVSVLFCAVNPGFSRCRDTSLIFSQAVDTSTAGADLLWSASITNPESQRYSSGSGWPYVSRTIIFNETASNPSACGSRDAWQIRPSERPPSQSDLWFCFISSACHAACRAAISMFHLAPHL